MRHPTDRFRRSCREPGRDVAADDALRQGDALVAAAWTRLISTLVEEALDETEKKVFTLHYGNDLPLDAITRLLGLSNRAGAKAYIVSARRKLRRAARFWKARQSVLDS